MFPADKTKGVKFRVVVSDEEKIEVGACLGGYVKIADPLWGYYAVSPTLSDTPPGSLRFHVFQSNTLDYSVGTMTLIETLETPPGTLSNVQSTGLFDIEVLDIVDVEASDCAMTTMREADIRFMVCCIECCS